MKPLTAATIALAAGLILFSTPARLFAQSQPSPHWPQFRGPGASGHSAGPALVTEWDIESGRNILWRTAIEGLGHASPIIWGERIYLVTAVSGAGNRDLRLGLYGDIAAAADESQHTWKVIALDRKSGEVVWSKSPVTAVPRIKRHTKATHANSTPATDGEHIVAFLGSEGIFCFDMNGELLWSRDLGTLDAGFFMMPTAQWGFGSSPVIHGGRVVIQCDVQGQSFLAALDVKTGETIWRTDRQEVPTWSTPAIATVGERTLIVVNGWKHIGAYDLETGAEVWRMTGGGDIPTPTPIISHGMAFITNAHGRMSPLYAINLTATGDITLTDGMTSSEHVRWSIARGGAYMPTPIVVGDLLFLVRDIGALTCFDIQTGEALYTERLPAAGGGVTASPVASGDRVYIPAESGDISIVRAGRTFELIGTHTVGDSIMASPAISNGVLYVRTPTQIIAIGAAR